MIRMLLCCIAACCLLSTAQAQEKLLYNTNFQDWVAVPASATEVTVQKTTDFSLETLTFKLLQNAVAPTGWDPTRFTLPATPGYIQAQKVAGSYIETTPLNSITKVSFTHGATGSSRGYKLWKKNATDPAWVLLSSNPATPAAGQTVTVNINESNVALRFTNINETQNAYLFDLQIYGNYTSANPQHQLVTALNIPAAGTITRTPNSDYYDQGSTVSLQATANFGYRFVKWVDSLDVDLSATNPYIVTMSDRKYVKAVFETVNTYNFTLGIVGSQWGEVTLNPAPTAGKYEHGTTVTMTVVPNPVTNFSFWEDNSTVLQRVVTVTSDLSFTATFDEIPFITGWNFKAQTPQQNRQGDFYSEGSNRGIISAYEPSGVTVNWLANLGSFTPVLPNIRLWTAGAEFLTKRRYVKASFSTINYTNIQVKSLVTANYQAYSQQTLQYSLNDTLWTEIGRTDITSVYNSSWAELNATLPANAENQQKVYVRWIADASSTILSPGNDNDGTALTNVFVYATKQLPPDPTPPQLISTVPAGASATATVNGSVILTFDEQVKAGSGSITLGTKVLTPSFGSKTVTLPYEKLAYNTTYTLTVPAGSIVDMSGNAFAGTTLTFSTAARQAPQKKLFDAVVAKDGSGDYTSVTAAIAAAPSNRTLPWLIYIQSGTYTGHHEIPASKPFIHLIGQHRDSVIISDSLLSGGPNAVHVSQGATMVVNASDTYFENITFENSYGVKYQAGPQALALYSEANHFTTSNCYLRSYQDTYLTSYNIKTNRHYLKNTKIEGAVDYIYGAGDVFFDQCTITNTRTAGGYIVAPSHPAGTLWGYVFSNCTIDEKYATNATNYFGRPWTNSPRTVFLHTKLKSGIYPQGWYYKMGAIPVIFADYGTVDANGNAVDLSQRIEDYEYDVKDANGNVIQTVTGKAKKSLTAAEAATYTYENVVLRTGDTWDPRLMAEAPEKPVNVIRSGNVITWDSVAYTRLYIVFRDNKVLGFTTATTFTDPNAPASGTVSYQVQAVGEFGALSLTSDAATAPLPVSLIDFTAALQNNGSVKTNWRTATETNVAGFVVERSEDAGRFIPVGNVNAVGNSLVQQSYGFIDETVTGLAVDAVYYRLKTVDRDGSFEMSKVIRVALGRNNALVQLAPNPTDGFITVRISYSAGTQLGLNIIDAAGRQVYQKTLVATQDVTEETVNTAALAPGVYFLRVQSAGGTTITRFIKR